MLLGLTLAGGYGAITPIKRCNTWSVAGPKWTGDTQLFSAVPRVAAATTGSKVSASTSAWAWDKKRWWWESNNHSVTDNVNKAHCSFAWNYWKSDHWWIIGWTAASQAAEYPRPPKKKDNKYFDNNRFHWFVLDSFISLIYILLGNLTPPVSVKGKAVQRKKGASIEREDGMWSA